MRYFIQENGVVKNVLYTNNHMQNSVVVSFLQDYKDVMPIMVLLVMIRFECLWERKDFHIIRDLICSLKEMVHSKILNESTTIHIMW